LELRTFSTTKNSNEVQAVVSTGRSGQLLSCAVQVCAAHAPQWSASVSDMRILLIPLLLMVAIVVTLALMATPPRSEIMPPTVTEHRR
jgi:hypothetical protein